MEQSYNRIDIVKTDIRKMRALTEKQMDLLRKLEKHELLEILEELVIPNTHNLRSKII